MPPKKFSKFHPKSVKLKDRCKHICKTGKQCQKPARIGNICLTHYLLLTKSKKKKIQNAPL